MKPNIYIGEEKVGRDDPRIQGGMNIIKETFDRAYDPEYEDLCTATSHITGKKINRFCHIHQSEEDLLKLVDNLNQKQNYNISSIGLFSNLYFIKAKAPLRPMSFLYFVGFSLGG